MKLEASCPRNVEFTYNTVYTKNCADVNARIYIATTVQRIEYDTVLSFQPAFNDDRLFKLFRDKNGGLPGSSKGIHHDIIGKNI